MHINEQMDQQHYNQSIPSEEEEDRVHGKNSVALEIGKDFLLPDSSVMRDDEGEENFAGSPEASSSSSTFMRLDYQSQLHPSDEENSLLLENRRAKNRKAAQKCREKKKEKIRVLENTVKDLKNDIRILNSQNVKLEEEKEQLSRLLKIHKRYCSLKTEDESMVGYPNEEQFYPIQEQYPRTLTQYQMYKEQANIPLNYSGYMYQAENLSGSD